MATMIDNKVLMVTSSKFLPCWWSIGPNWFGLPVLLRIVVLGLDTSIVHKSVPSLKVTTGRTGPMLGRSRMFIIAEPLTHTKEAAGITI